MHDAGLMNRLGERGLDRAVEAGQPVGAQEQDVVDAAVLELREDLEPELGSLRLCDPQPQDVSFAIETHAQSDVEGALLDVRTITDAHDDRVEIHDGVDGLERALLPGSEL